MCDEEAKGGAALPDLLNGASAALLLLFSARSQLLLSHGHLLLHAGELLLGPASVVLEKENTNR